MPDEMLTDLLTRFEICLREEMAAAAVHTAKTAATETCRRELQDWAANRG